jgi:GTPase SAR1 family protein
MLTNLLIIGNTDSGKTTYIRKLEQFWDYDESYSREMQSYERMVSIKHPDLGTVNVYDSNNMRMVNDIYDGVIIMCAESLPSIEQYKEQIFEKCGDIPIMILFNKYDLDDVKTQYEQYQAAHPEDTVRYCSALNVNIGNVRVTFQEIVTSSQ